MQTETLLRRVQTGDADALDALVREYYPQILNYCRWHVPDAQQAQDAAQETFYKAVRWLDGCGGFAGQFRPFLYKIAKTSAPTGTALRPGTAPRWKACPRSRVIRKRALTRPKTR